MAKASLWSAKGCLYIFGGLFLAVALVLEVSKWEVHVSGEGVELVRRASPQAIQIPAIGATLAQSLAVATGKQSERRAPSLRRKYSLPWKAEAEETEKGSVFHAGIRSSRQIEEELGLGFQPKLGLKNGTLTWSAEAEDFLLNLVIKRQFPPDCGAVKWLVIDPHRHGLGSSTHTYVLTLLMSLSLNRTLVINEEPPDLHQDGCIPASITTLFEPHTHCSFATNPEKREAYQKPEAAMDWRQILQSEEDLENLDVIRLTDTVPRPRGWSWERWERWQAEGWWEGLWGQLIDSGSVSVVGGGPLSEVSMQTQQMMLWANVLNWMWRPTQRVQRIARAILCNHEAQKPLVSVHIRRTDKEVEDPYWREHHQYRPLRDYGTTVAKYAEAIGSDISSVFVFSDSAALMKELSSTGLSVLGLHETSTELILDDYLELSPIEANWSHERVGCEQKNQIVEHLVAAMEIALENSEYIVMTMGSSVGRIMAEVMAGRRRIAFPQPASPFTRSLDVDWFYDW